MITLNFLTIKKIVIINTEEFSNASIFQAHSNILRQRSLYFRKELAKARKDHNNIKTINLKHISTKQFEIIIKYIYGGVFLLESQDASFIFDLMLVANEFLLDELAKFLEKHLIEEKVHWLRLHFTQIYQKSFQNNQFQNLQKWCNDFLAKYPNNIFESDNFTSLQENALVSLIKRDDLQMEEVKIWNYMIKWGIAQNPGLPSDGPENWTSENFLAVKTTLQNCLPHIRYFQILGDDIIDNIEPYQTILERDLWKDIMKRSVNPNRNISSIILPPRITLTAKNLPPRITSTPKLGDHTVEPNIGLVSTAKNIIGGTLSRFIGKDDDEYKECIQVTFHVHLPQHIERFGEPVVVGSCKELGNWRMVRILLTQPNKREFPTYWRSQPIEIQPSKDEIKYKYGVFDRSSGRVEFEGEGERHNRTLDTKTNDQYDIWKNNNRFRIFNLNEFAFIRCIYDAVNDENLKDKVMQFQLLLTNHRTHTLNFMTLDFITQRYQKKEKRLFLSVLLGYYIIDKGSPAFIFQLPKQFRSELLLEAFEHVQQDTFTSDIKPIIAPVVAALVRHNAMVMISFEWLRIFRVAQFVDPAYTFVDEFIGAHYDKKYISRLLKEWPEIVKPHLDRIDESTYIKIAKWLISCCSNMETVNIMSQYNIEDTLLRSNNEICVDYVVNALMPAVHEDYIKTLKKLI